ncbi:Na+/H+ antiporter [Paraburkholderia sp. A3BS-1L]|uniref:Na+/H+ antiporter n=1 Tax=Paraburkholderia sp. A3BS-1L TaxID=3028375 RepID=UPI003DA8B2C3
MSAVSAFKLVLLSLIAIIALELLAKRLRLPPAAALLVGGAAMAFAPGLPPVVIDPDLVLIVFLPPLLMNGAYFFVWADFKRHITPILLYAIGAVAFTTWAVGLVAHWMAPGLPWAVCFALGAVVSPPDAVAAKAVLERLALPRRLMVLLEGESLLNDAAGLVLFRLAVAAALTGAFSTSGAVLSFSGLALGGIAIGWFVGYLTINLLRLLDDDYLIITASVSAAWFSYIAGEMAGVSSVIATVTCGMYLGWHQHEVFSARVRMRGTAFWEVLVFVLEALVFVLIGLSLRGVIHRLGGAGEAFAQLGPAALAIVAAVVLSRCVWAFGLETIRVLVHRFAPRRIAAADLRSAAVVSWAGMRGVVTLAIALTLPESLPGRDLILFAAFAVILFTVLLQGLTIGPLIRLVKPLQDEDANARYLTEPQAWARLLAVQLEAIQPLVHGPDGSVIHPRLLEQYTYRANLSRTLESAPALPNDVRTAHYDVVLAAVSAGRAEVLRLHRAGLIDDAMLHMIERDLDLEEVGAQHSRG